MRFDSIHDHDVIGGVRIGVNQDRDPLLGLSDLNRFHSCLDGDTHTGFRYPIML